MFPNLIHQCFRQKMIGALPRQKIHKIHVCRICANFVPEHISPTWSRWWEALWWIWGMRLTWCAFLGNHSEDSLPEIFPILTNHLTFLISTFLVFHKTGLSLILGRWRIKNWDFLWRQEHSCFIPWALAQTVNAREILRSHYMAAWQQITHVFFM